MIQSSDLQNLVKLQEHFQEEEHVQSALNRALDDAKNDMPVTITLSGMTFESFKAGSVDEDILQLIANRHTHRLDEIRQKISDLIETLAQEVCKK